MPIILLKAKALTGEAQFLKPITIAYCLPPAKIRFAETNRLATHVTGFVGCSKTMESPTWGLFRFRVNHLQA